MASDDEVSRIRDIQKNMSADEPFNIQFTSGTTGRQKAVLTSHFSLINIFYLFSKENSLDKKHHKMCLQVPLYHNMGIVAGMLMALFNGCTLVMPCGEYEPEKYLRAIQDQKCTYVLASPPMLIELVDLQEELKLDIAPEVIHTGGNVFTPKWMDTYYKVLKPKRINVSYGLSESTCIIFHTIEGEDMEKTYYKSGHLQQHLEVKVVDEEGHLVPFGTPGELLIRGFSNMIKFYNDEEETKKTIQEDGWLKTGDKFIIEEDGYGTIVGRLKDMIVVHTENVWPKEVEMILGKHPKIQEVHVIGIPYERTAEQVVACVKVEEGENLTLEELRHFCKDELVEYKIPTKLTFFKEFPRTKTGKVQKFKLQEIVVQGL